MKKCLLILTVFVHVFSCSKEPATEYGENVDLFWDCESIEAIEPFKFDYLDSAGKPITFEPTYLKYDTIRNRLVVKDAKKFKILIISLEGEILQEIGQKGEAVSELSHPGHFDIDKNGNIYIIDNTKVEIYDTLGIEFRSFVPKYRPWQIMVEDTNAIYILTARPTDSKKVLGKYDINGNLLEEYVDKIEIDHPVLPEKTMMEMLANQTTMCRDSEGNIYVAFANDYRIDKVCPDGSVIQNYITKEMPFEVIKIHVPDYENYKNEIFMHILIMDIAADEKGNLYVLWGENFGIPYCRVDVYDITGEQVGVIKLSIPYPGEYRQMYMTGIGSFVVVDNILYAAEYYSDGLIYRYDLGNRF